MATEVRPSAAVELTLLSKERPLAAEMKAWVEENLTRLPPDQRALVMGVVHLLPTLVRDIEHEREAEQVDHAALLL